MPWKPAQAVQSRDEHNGCEREQLQHDVPVLPVVTLAHNIFTDQRQPLGFSNLLTSFQSGAPVRSADTGNEHCGTVPHRPEPGVPV